MVVEEKNRESGVHVAGRKVIEKQGEREISEGSVHAVVCEGQSSVREGREGERERW